MLEKGKHPLLKIKEKELGQVTIFMALFTILFVFLLLIVQFQILTFKNMSIYIEDGLVTANLSSAIIDMREFGTSNRIIIKDPNSAYSLFKESLEYSIKNEELLICDYHIYNVEEEGVVIYRLKDGIYFEKEFVGKEIEVFTPDMVKVENTTIYSRISFLTPNLLGSGVYGEKEKSVDITRIE